MFIKKRNVGEKNEMLEKQKCLKKNPNSWRNRNV